MMGQIFTEFLELVEDKFGYEVVDELLTQCQLSSEGIYTAVGVYAHEELLALVVKLSEVVDAPINDLVQTFGESMFVKLIGGHPEITVNIDNAFELMSKIDDYIHVEVYKLYPNAQLPAFSFQQISDNEVSLHYQSTRPFASFAEGLLHGCGKYFHESLEITRSALSGNSDTDVIFNIKRLSEETLNV